MGIFSGVSDFLFGGQNDSQQEKQAEQNAVYQQYVMDSADQARGDALSLQPLVNQAFHGGYQSAADMLGGATEQALNTFGEGNYTAQQSLLAGMPQYQNAILGLPVNNAALQPMKLNPQENLGFMFNPKLPDIGKPQNYGDFLSGNTDAGKFASYVQPGVTNRALVSKAHNLGLIDDAAYGQFQQTFDNSSGLADSISWGHAGSAEPLIGNIKNAHPQWRGTLENFFQLLYPNG